MKVKTSLSLLPLLLTILLFRTFPVSANISKEPEVGITEHLDQYLPDDIILTDHNGKEVNFKQLINKPTVLCFVYFRCPGVCSPLMNGLAETMGSSTLQLGKDYQAITISFDAREGYGLAQKKRDTYLKKIKGQDGSAWTFLTGDSLNIAKATEAVGFRFKFVNSEFMHEAALIMISPDGKITRYLKGISFLPFEFKLAIIEASKGKSSPTVNKVLQFCYTYDPASQHYSLNIIRLSAVFTLVFAVSVFAYLLFRGQRKKTNAQPL